MSSFHTRFLAAACATVLTATFLQAAPTLKWSATVDTGASIADRTRAVALMSNGDVIAASQIGSGTAAQIRVQRLAAATGAAAWTRDVGTAGFADDVADMVIEPATGNAYIAARSATAASGLDWLVCKVNGSDGTLAWSNSVAALDTTGNDQPRAICLTSDGNVAVAGMQTNVVTGASLFAVAKLNAGTGVPIWINAGATDDSDAMAIAADGSGNVIAVGRRGADAYVAKYASGGGVPTWAQTLNGNGNGNDIWNAVTLLSTGDIVVAGTLVESVGGGNLAVARYPSAGGAATWVRTVNGNVSVDAVAFDAAFDVTADGAGDVYTAGFLSNTTGQSAYVAKISGATGAVTWSHSANGTSSTPEATNAYFGVRLAGTDVFASGVLSGSASNCDIVVSHFNTGGAFKETTTFDGAAHNQDLSLSRHLLAAAGLNFAIAGDTENATPSADGIVLRYSLPAPVPDIAVAQAGPLTDGVSSVDFGTVPVGGSSGALNFTITNPGGADLASLALTQDGANAGDFSVSALSGTGIPVGAGTVTFTVTFTPGASGPRSAAIHIASNVAGAKNPFDIGLTGTGVNIYTLTYTAGPNGTITGTTPQTVIEGASGTEVTATPDAGYHFVNWSDGVPTAARTDSNVLADLSVTATFGIDLPTHDARYTSGGDVPGAANGGIPAGATWTSFGVPAINDAGEVAFLGKWSSPTALGAGIFVDDTLVAKTGDSTTLLGGATFKSFRDPVIDAAGHVAFLGTVTGAGVTTANNVVLATNAFGAVEVVARARDVLIAERGVPALKSFTSLSLVDGEVLFTAKLQGGRPPVTSANDHISLRVAGVGITTHVVREGDPLGATTVKSFQLLGAVSGSPAQNRAHAAGTATFLALLANGTEALVGSSGGTLDPLEMTGETTGGLVLPAATFKSFGVPAADGARLAFVSTLTSGVGGVTSTNARGVFKGPVGAIEPVARVGDATGVGATTFGALEDPVLAPGADSVAFPATLKGATPAEDATLWWQPAGGPLTLLARQGAQPPEVPMGARWNAFTSVALPGGNTGPLFLATLLHGPGGVDATRDVGVWGVSSVGALRLLFREGDTVAGKVVKNFVVLKAVSGTPGVTRAFNNHGQVAWSATFTDGTTAIVVTQVP